MAVVSAKNSSKPTALPKSTQPAPTTAAKNTGQQQQGDSMENNSHPDGQEHRQRDQKRSGIHTLAPNYFTRVFTNQKFAAAAENFRNQQTERLATNDSNCDGGSRRASSASTSASSTDGGCDTMIFHSTNNRNGHVNGSYHQHRHYTEEQLRSVAKPVRPKAPPPPPIKWGDSSRPSFSQIAANKIQSVIKPTAGNNAQMDPQSPSRPSTLALCNTAVRQGEVLSADNVGLSHVIYSGDVSEQVEEELCPKNRGETPLYHYSVTTKAIGGCATTDGELSLCSAASPFTLNDNISVAGEAACKFNNSADGSFQLSSLNTSIITTNSSPRRLSGGSAVSCEKNQRCFYALDDDGIGSKQESRPIPDVSINRNDLPPQLPASQQHLAQDGNVSGLYLPPSSATAKEESALTQLQPGINSFSSSSQQVVMAKPPPPMPRSATRPQQLQEIQFSQKQRRCSAQPSIDSQPPASTAFSYTQTASSIVSPDSGFEVETVSVISDASSMRPRLKAVGAVVEKTAESGTGSVCTSGSFTTPGAGASALRIPPPRRPPLSNSVNKHVPGNSFDGAIVKSSRPSVINQETAVKLAQAVAKEIFALRTITSVTVENDAGANDCFVQKENKQIQIDQPLSGHEQQQQLHYNTDDARPQSRTNKMKKKNKKGKRSPASKIGESPIGESQTSTSEAGNSNNSASKELTETSAPSALFSPTQLDAAVVQKSKKSAPSVDPAFALRSANTSASTYSPSTAIALDSLASIDRAVQLPSSKKTTDENSPLHKRRRAAKQAQLTGYLQAEFDSLMAGVKTGDTVIYQSSSRSSFVPFAQVEYRFEAKQRPFEQRS